MLASSDTPIVPEYTKSRCWVGCGGFGKTRTGTHCIRCLVPAFVLLKCLATILVLLMILSVAWVDCNQQSGCWKFIFVGWTIRFPGWTLVIILSVFLLGRLPSFLQHYKKGVMKNSMNKNELKLPFSKGDSMPSNIKISISSLTIMKDTRHRHSPDPPGNHNWLDAVLIICISLAFMLGSFSKFNRPCGSISSRWVHWICNLSPSSFLESKLKKMIMLYEYYW